MKRFSRCDLLKQTYHFNGFGIDLVAACSERPFPIAGHRIRRERDDRNELGARIGFEPNVASSPLISGSVMSMRIRSGVSEAAMAMP
jgi:hypothetical protein